MIRYLCAIALFVVFGPIAAAQTNAQLRPPASTTAGEPFTYEFYYKVKWGHLEEFLQLYKRNHLPILLEQKKRGEILSLSANFPINHMGEDTRWDFRMTVTYRDAIAAHEDPSEQSWAIAMYPDQKKFKVDELRRFELVLEHLDLPVTSEDPASW